MAIFQAMAEIMRAVREGSESNARAARMCVLYVIFVGVGFAAAASLVAMLGA